MFDSFLVCFEIGFVGFFVCFELWNMFGIWDGLGGCVVFVVVNVS